MAESAAEERAPSSYRAEVPVRGLRVLMLTTDEWIDRRIVAEASSLIEAGYDVYVLAAPHGGRPGFEHDGQVPVERVNAEQYGPLVEHVLLRAYRKEPYRPAARVGLRAYRAWRGSARRLLNGIERLLELARLRPAGVLFPSLQLPSYEYAFFRRARFYRPDIVHVHDLPLLRLGAAIKARTGARLVYDMHEFYPEQYALQGRQRMRARRLERRHIKLTDERFTVNHHLARMIAESYGVDVGVVQNATRVPEGLHDRRYDRFREELGIAPDRRVLLTQGWLAPNRNLEKIVEAMASVAVPAVLVLMGYGEYRRELERVARETGADARVYFVDAKDQDELLTYTASADVGLIPYPRGLDVNTTYVSPNKLYEFIAARLPMLGNDIPFVREVVEGNGFGVVADLQTPASAAAAIDTFPYAELRRFRENLAARGFEWTWEAEQQKLLRIYDAIGERHAQPDATRALGSMP